jgi:hypothetical protein
MAPLPGVACAHRLGGSFLSAADDLLGGFKTIIEIILV